MSRNTAASAVVFVGSDIASHAALVAAIDADVGVVVYDGARDGLRQIAASLTGRQGLDAVHILSHGSTGEIRLGTAVLSLETLAAHLDDLEAIGESLASTGQIAFYGCNVASDGTALLDAVGQACGRDVAASTTPTGPARLGGDWRLAASTGAPPRPLPADAAALDAFDGVLVTTEEEIQATNTGSTVQVNATATDAAGDLFVTGQFDGSVAFGNGTTLNNPNSHTNAFVAKYNSAGVLQWAQNYNDSGAINDAGNGLAVSSDGTKVYVGGTYNGTLQFDGSHSITSSANGSAFLVQLNGSGTYQWSAKIGGGPQQSSFDDLAVDASGNVLALGDYASSAGSNPAVLTPATGSPTTLQNTNGHLGTLVVKLNASGATQWTASVSSPNTDNISGFALATDSSNNVYLSGRYAYDSQQNTYVYSSDGSSTPVSTASSSPNYGTYLAKLDSTGKFQWDHAINTSTNYGSPEILGIAVDQYGPVVTGNYVDGTTIGGKTQHTHIYTNSSSLSYSSKRAFVEQFNSGGASQWAKTESDNGKVGDDTGTKITVDKGGNIVVAGTYYSAKGDTTADSFDGTNLTPVANRGAGFIWDIRPGSSSGTTQSVGSFTSANGNVSIGGLAPSSSNGVVTDLNVTSQTDANPGSGVSTVDSANRSASPFVALSGSDLGEPPPPTIASGGYKIGVVETATSTAAAPGALTGDTNPSTGNTAGLTIGTVTYGTGSPVAAGTAVTGAYGTLTLDSDGSYSYAATKTSAIDSAATGSHPVDSYAFTVSNAGGSANETFAATIDRAPTGTGAKTNAPELTTTSGNALANESDPDGDTTFSVASISYNGTPGTVGQTITGKFGDLTLNADGSYSYDANNAVAYASTPAGQRMDDFTYSVADAGGAKSAAQTLEFDITCFVTGTRIRVDRAGRVEDIAVEALAVGDVAVTSSGAGRPIRWIGSRLTHCRRHPRPREAMPICVAAHSFGEHRPARDLLVSPGHAICVDILGEVLIPAGALVNGSTIRQVEVDELTYWHVELDSHDIVLAENLPAESYLDMGNRGFFEEAHVVDLAAGPDTDPSRRTHADFCRPVHGGGPLVDGVRAQLARHAATRGWTLAHDLALHLEVDGQRVDPVVRGLTAQFPVPAGAQDVWLMSPTARPCDTMGSGDTRDLGVCVAALRIDDGDGSHVIAMDDPLLCVGFHAVEDGVRRWTAGRARLPAALWDRCADGFHLRVELAGMPVPRWTAPADEAFATGGPPLAIVA